MVSQTQHSNTEETSTESIQHSKLTATNNNWNLDRSLREHKPITFPTQRPDEHVILLLRRHWTVLARDVIQLVASLLIPPVILTVLLIYTPFSLIPGSILYILVVEALSLYYLFSFLAYFHDFIDYHLDIWVVTDQRIVSIEQSGLFNRVVSELNVYRIQDVTSEIKGKVQTFLDYGQVHIQTAAEKERFVFEQITHPSEVAKIILQVHDRATKKMEIDRMRREAAYGEQFKQQQAVINQNKAAAIQDQSIQVGTQPSAPVQQPIGTDIHRQNPISPDQTPPAQFPHL